MSHIPNPLSRAAVIAASLAAPTPRRTVYRVQNAPSPIARHTVQLVQNPPAPISRGTVYHVQNDAHGDRPTLPAAKSRGPVYRVQNTLGIASR